jgi:hypothetical protein
MAKAAPAFWISAAVAAMFAIPAAAEVSPQQLLQIAKTAYPGDLCWWERAEEDSDQIRAHEIGFRYEYDEADAPERKVTVYEMPCLYGAYNFGTLWFIESEYDGLVPMHFAEPEIDVTYSDDENTTVESIRIAGFRTTPVLINSYFDEETDTITNFSKWRGLGDAASSGTWIFDEGKYVLSRFQVDPTHDGEINPVVIYDAEPN